MAYQKKGKGAYYYQFMKDGHRYYGTCRGCTDQKSADRYEEKMRQTADKALAQKSYIAFIENFRDDLTGGEKIALTDAYERYLEKPTKRSPAEDQIRRNRTYWLDFVAFMQARHPDVTVLQSVTRQQAEEYIAYLRKHGAFQKGVTMTRGRKTITYRTKAEQLSPRTLNGRHKAIKAVFARLKEEAGLQSNPFDILTLDNHTTSREAFTPDELKRIEEHITMPYTKPVFVIGLCTGQTMGDICLLKWSEIAGNWITNKLRRKTGSRLEIPILPPLARFLEEQRQVSGESEYVCPELAEMYLHNGAGVFYRVQQCLHEAGITTATKVNDQRRAVSTKAAHAMRHTFAAFAGIYNIPQPIVQSVLGHMTPRMTELYQQHATREQKARFFQQMPNLLGLSTAEEKVIDVTADPVIEPSLHQEPERVELTRIIQTLDLAAVKALLSECYVSYLPKEGGNTATPTVETLPNGQLSFQL